ncbi:winged helix-turn-helix transcriptional regulator [Candidatus Bathyarchaeota archaeon]|nr:winged helix-turn-helix transcriptional regulator [Candidatus Bathyarchaeota archaeon]
MISLISKTPSKTICRLIESGLCKGEDPLKYERELKDLAETVADAENAKKQSIFFKGLGDEKRIRILKLLSVREMCNCELMVALDMSQPTTSHHLSILENTGLVSSRKEGRWVFYSIVDRDLLEKLLKP